MQKLTGPMLCFSTLGCVDVELEQALGLAKSYGLPAIELRGLGGTLDLSSYFEGRFGNPRELVACFHDYGIWPASMDASASLGEIRPDDRTELTSLLPWAVAAGAGHIRVFDGGTTGSDDELRTMGLNLEWWAEQDAPIPLAVETHDILAHPQVLNRFLELYPDARLLWDTHHTWHTGQEAPAISWAKLQQRTAHLHIKDSVKSGRERTLVPPGAGGFPHRELMQALTGAPVVVSLEWERYWHPEIGPIKPALDAFTTLYSTLLGDHTT